MLPGRDFADVRSALFDAIEEATAGAIITDRALARAAQISYLPGRGALYEHEIADGDFLDLHEDHPVIVRAEAARRE